MDAIQGPISKQNKNIHEKDCAGAGKMAQWLKCFPHKCDNLGSMIPGDSMYWKDRTDFLEVSFTHTTAHRPVLIHTQ